jgi:hypothetical protein
VLLESAREALTLSRLYLRVLTTPEGKIGSKRDQCLPPHACSSRHSRLLSQGRQQQATQSCSPIEALSLVMPGPMLETVRVACGAQVDKEKAHEKVSKPILLHRIRQDKGDQEAAPRLGTCQDMITIIESCLSGRYCRDFLQGGKG